MKLQANTWYEFSISVQLTEDTDIPDSGTAGSTIDTMEYLVRVTGQPDQEEREVSEMTLTELLARAAKGEPAKVRKYSGISLADIDLATIRIENCKFIDLDCTDAD